MPAMRIFMPVILLALTGSSALSASVDMAAAADQPSPVQQGDTVRRIDSAPRKNVQQAAIGPLAPQARLLDDLYAKLKRERSPEVARALAERIREVMAPSGSATADMMMTASAKALEEKRFGAALDFADQVTLIAPDFADGWNRRATIHYLMGNFPKSMSDVARTLALEPRHLGALSGMAAILEDNGRSAQALETWQSYLGYFPADRDAQKQALDLLDKLSGQKT